MDTGYFENLIKRYITNKCLSTKIIGETDKDCTVSFKVKSGDFEINNTFTVLKKDVLKWEEERIR